MAQRGVNKVIVVGNVGSDPEVKNFDNGGSIANLSIATSETWKDKESGEQQERTEWHRVTFRGGLVKIVEQYVKKGSRLYVEGKLQTRKWQDQDGKDQFITEIVVDMGGQMQMLDSPASEGGQRRSTPPAAKSNTQSTSSNTKASSDSGQKTGKVQQAKEKVNTMPEPVDDFDDDIPF